jgi:hypothetical protein
VEVMARMSHERSSVGPSISRMVFTALGQIQYWRHKKSRESHPFAE